MDNYKLKVSIFALLIVTLIVILFYGTFGFSLSYLSEEEIKENRKSKEDLINSFKINNIDAAYDKESNIYYYSVPDSYEKKKYTLKLELGDGYKYKILNHATNIVTVNYDKEYKLLIYNDKYYYETKLVLTNLPLFIIVTDTDITDNDTNSTFKYINPNNLDKTVSYNSKIRVRGATSKRYDKKSYKLEVYDTDYESEKNINISNFYYGSSYILDATYRDNSKIRNILAIELWNKISDDFTNVDIYSEFVELFINGEYKGLYVFTEPINRKSLNLNKNSDNDTSVIIKSNDWQVAKGSSSFSNIFDDAYLGYELKYPNEKKLFNSSWKTILPKLAKYYNKDQKIKYDELKEVFDINNYIDLVIFNSFINNSDNRLRKNNYYYLKNLNSKINIQPWDMEFSFGLKFDDYSYNDFSKDMNDYENIILDIKHESNEINKLLINRYWNLRKNILTKEYIDTIIDSYEKDLLKGGTIRDANKWLSYNAAEEIEEIRTWIYKRIEFYDNYIRGLENE